MNSQEDRRGLELVLVGLLGFALALAAIVWSATGIGALVSGVSMANRHCLPV